MRFSRYAGFTHEVGIPAGPILESDRRGFTPIRPDLLRIDCLARCAGFSRTLTIVSSSS